MASTKDRIDWMPCVAAKDAVRLGQQMWPGLSRQAVIDRLVIDGISAVLHRPWREPILHGSRHRWELPPEVAALAEKAIPGKGRV